LRSCRGSPPRSAASCCWPARTAPARAWADGSPAAAGAWFVVGPPLAPLWDPGTLGVPLGGTTRQALEWIGFFYGLGVAIVFVAAVALGRLMARDVRDVDVA
jgi:hypothetical protein